MQVNVVEKDGMIIIQGPIIFETVATIQRSISQLQHQLTTESRVDLTAVTEVNSAALGLFVELKKHSLEAKRNIRFLAAPEKLLSLAQVYGVASWLGL